MSEITHEYAESFFNALSSREPARIAPFIADDADWLTRDLAARPLPPNSAWRYPSFRAGV